jgi:abhydrolase domain-containing protein 6
MSRRRRRLITHPSLLITAVTIALLAIVTYARPLAVYSTARAIYLFAIGVRGHDIQVGPHRIHYLKVGEGPPLVLVHGVAMRAADLAPLFRSLSRQHTVYAPDLLGYGDSDKPRDADYSVTLQTGVVRGFLDAMKLEQPDVMGVSMGGWIAMKLAAEHPERVKRLVLVSSAGFTFKTSLNELSFSARTIAELRASLSLQTDRAGMIPEFILRDILRQSKEKSWIVRASMRSMLTKGEVLDNKLQRVTMPVLLVWGTADRIVPFSVAARMRREMPHAELVALDGCGHLAIIECRTEAMPPIVAFLTRDASPVPLREPRASLPRP